MKVIADSHTIVWYLTDPDRLSEVAIVALDDADDTEGVGVSIASIPDIWYSTQKNGPSHIDPMKYERVKAALVDPLTNAHVLSISENAMAYLDVIPRNDLPDPFDRLIVATALEHNLALVTKDKRITDLGVVATIW